MKKKHPNVSIIRGIFCCVAVLFLNSVAFASTELDKRYELASVGVLKPWDNSDGLFTSPITTAFQSYFAQQSRFIVNDLTRADVILSYSKLPYSKVITDTEVLGQIARSTHSQ